MDDFAERIETGSSSEGSSAGEEFWSTGAGHVAQEKVVEEKPDSEGMDMETDQWTPQGQRQLQLGSAGKQMSADSGKGTAKLEGIEKPGELPGIVPNPNRRKWTGSGEEVEDSEVTTGGDLGKKRMDAREAPDRKESGMSALRGKEATEGNPVGTEASRARKAMITSGRAWRHRRRK
jgi:hypothetical protein